MIYPRTLNPSDVNTTLMRVADSHDAEIEFMQNEIKNMQAQETDIENRFKAYQDRWERYQDSYKEILHSFYAMNGNLTVEEMKKNLMWNRDD
jgi:predicted nuclease with TOPRIM domain